MPALPSFSPAERRSALTLAAAGTLVLAAALAPVAPPTAEPPAGLALSPAFDEGAPAGAALAASPFDPARRAVDGLGALPPDGFAPEAAPPPPIVEEMTLRLAGILVEGGARKAMFAGLDGWHGVGAAVGDWTVAAVEPDGVTVRRGADEMVLSRADALLR